jgi:excisionase family DNA binding protein
MEPTRSQLFDAADLTLDFRPPGIFARLARLGHLLASAPASRVPACPHACQAASVAWVASLLINTIGDFEMVFQPALPRALPMLTVDDVAQQLQLWSKTARRMIARDDLPAHRIGRQLRVAPGDLRAFISRGRTGVGM